MSLQSSRLFYLQYITFQSNQYSMGDLNSSMTPSPLALKQLNALYISAPVLPDAPVLPEHLFLPVSARMSALVICGVI